MKKYKIVLLSTVALALGATGLFKAGAQFEGPPYRIDAMSSPMHMSPIPPARDNSRHPSHARGTRRQSDIPHNPGDYPADLNDYERTDTLNSGR